MDTPQIVPPSIDRPSFDNHHPKIQHTNLEDVVLGDRGHGPGLLLVPGEVRHLARVPPVDEEQLRGAVL